jgi:hypothetical protein
VGEHPDLVGVAEQVEHALDRRVRTGLARGRDGGVAEPPEVEVHRVGRQIPDDVPELGLRFEDLQ